MELLGKTLGNYRINSLLGEGGMGAVYHARDLVLERDVAIKVIHEQYARQADFRNRFLQEARILAKLDHPGIVKVFVLGEEQGLLYLPMEFIQGGNLRQLLDNLIQTHKWLPLHEAVRLMEQLCQTVEYAHQHKVLHRDIKPANLMIKRVPVDGLPFRIILTDLGLARILEGQGLTQMGMAVGTPAYMSPEQAVGKDTDPRSDVYSLGVLLYELAVGRLPFPVRTLSEAARYHNQEPPPHPRSIRPDLPEPLERVILKTLEKDPDKRYHSALSLGIALSSAMTISTGIEDLKSGQDSSLITEYNKSVVPSTAPQSTTPLTKFDNGSLAQRGPSVFAGPSLPPSSQPRLQVIHRDQTAQVFPIPRGTITIGRKKDNQVVLDDTKASRWHAQIIWQGGEFQVMDLNSSNGTYLDNKRLLAGVAEVWRPDQNLRIGDTWLRLILPSSRASDQSPSWSRSQLASSGNFHNSLGTERSLDDSQRLRGDKNPKEYTQPSIPSPLERSQSSKPLPIQPPARKGTSNPNPSQTKKLPKEVQAALVQGFLGLIGVALTAYVTYIITSTPPNKPTPIPEVSPMTSVAVFTTSPSAIVTTPFTSSPTPQPESTTFTPTLTATTTASPTSTLTPTITPSNTPTSTITPSLTPSRTPTPTFTDLPMPAPSLTPIPSRDPFTIPGSAVLCDGDNYSGDCEGHNFAGQNMCINLGSINRRANSFYFTGEYQGNFEVIFYHDSNCNTYLARYGSAASTFGNLNDQFSSIAFYYRWQ